ncbi:MAG TPA: L,D-transpeptidase family protein [Longimicrobiaceae bacterium]|nr:L,D-transpeptidase family protein [Longimicrobiaceae bacterium]
MTLSRPTALALLALASACTFGDRTDEGQQRERGVAQAATPRGASPYWGEERPLTPEELESGRLDEDWTRVVQLDPWTAGNQLRNPERWEQISAETVNNGPVHLPVFGDVGGPTVLRIQILLDRAFFSPGVIDGRWGKNTAKAVYWLQKREGLRATGRADSTTFARLVQLAGEPEELVRAHRLTAGNVEGPFIDLPEGNGDEIYEIAEKECTCYEALTEKLTETFHATTELLRQLNPGVELDGLRAGQTLNVPNVRDPDARAPGRVARIEVSGRGSFLHALDANGRILYHFPSTLGSTYDPSPQGRFTITSITENPWWHYQPAILAHVPDDKPEARIPPGPNNAVGVVWMDLSVPHYGIHGTRSPETIGYTTSAGCVRLTNWDALFLSRRVSRGTPVRFRDTRSGSDTASVERRREGERAREREKSREESGTRTRPDTTRRRSAR